MNFIKHSMGDRGRTENNEGLNANDVLEVVRSTSSAYVSSLERRYRRIYEETEEKRVNKAEKKRVTHSLNKILDDLVTKKEQQLEEHSEERKKAEERMAILENEILNMQIYTSNLNEHNDLMKWFIQMWKTKFAEVRKRLSK